jgi:hypothetical protein
MQSAQDGFDADRKVGADAMSGFVMKRRRGSLRRVGHART